MFRHMIQTWQILQMVNFLRAKYSMVSLQQVLVDRFGPRMEMEQVYGAHQQGLQALALQLIVRTWQFLARLFQVQVVRLRFQMLQVQNLVT